MRLIALIWLFALLAMAKGCPCPRNIDPVCGSDNLSYHNECLLLCWAKATGRVITVAKSGYC